MMNLQKAALSLFRFMRKGASVRAYNNGSKWPVPLGINCLVLILLVILMASSCTTVPITGRRQLNLIPDDSIIAMSLTEYDKFLSTHKLSNDPQKTAMVKRVGSRIAKAVETYLASHGMAGEIKKYSWEFNLVQSDEINAWCMPGGKVVVYTGILPVAKDETGLAVVLGHEIAHAVAKHGNERMSQGLLAQFGGMALEQALSDRPAATRQLLLAAYGLGAQVGVLLPYSRLQEKEADHLGLIFMAMAGYNPAEAVNFWKRMASLKKGGELPEFLSTHPADAKRIKAIKALLPEAMKYYHPRNNTR